MEKKNIIYQLYFGDICQENKNIILFIYEKVKNNVVYK